jgi:hypothetical protein
MMRSRGVLERKPIDRRYADQAALNQMGDLPHRVASSLKVDGRSDLVEIPALGLLPSPRLLGSSVLQLTATDLRKGTFATDSNRKSTNVRILSGMYLRPT